MPRHPFSPNVWHRDATLCQKPFSFFFDHTPVDDKIIFQFEARLGLIIYGQGISTRIKYGGRQPYDTGPLVVHLITGSGDAGCRILL